MAGVGKKFVYLNVMLALVPLILGTQTMAQSLQLSKNADFSTTDGLFTFDDVLHAKVTAPQIDFSDLKDNEFRLKPVFGDDDNDVEGAFTNNFNGTYEAHIPLSGLIRTENTWEFRAKIRDDKGNKFESKIRITIQDVPGAGDTLLLAATIDSTGSNFLLISGNQIFVDSATVITEDGAPLAFAELKKNWKVNVVAERRADSLFWALTIDVLQRTPEGQEIEIEGVIASIDSALMIVSSIRFLLDSTTRVEDNNGHPLERSLLAVGMLVKARGVLDAQGNVVTRLIQLKSALIEGREFELLGRITTIIDDSTGRFVGIQSTLFAVDNQTVLLGFENEPLSFSDLRVGELVEVKARARTGLPPLAERIKREDEDGDDIRIKGTILAMTDSSLTVGQLVFKITPTTIVFDDKNNFISFTELRTGLVVEVRANVEIDGSLTATRVKVEDIEENEIEIKGFIDALTDSTISVSGLLFQVKPLTEVLDRDGQPIAFADLRVGMIVEIRGEISFRGTLTATRIQIEDVFEDEIEVRGAITALGGDSLVVAGVAFFVDAATQIVDRDGLPISLAALQVGLIVEIRAVLRDGRWLTNRIQIEDRIDTLVEIRARVDSLADDRFFLLGHTLIVNNITRFFDRQGLPATFSDLQVGDIVTVRALTLGNAMLLALRVSLQEDELTEVEVTGGISALSFTEITAGSFTFAIDATTEYFDAENRPIRIEDLHLGMVVHVRAVQQQDGSLLALRVTVQNRRSLTGQVTAVAAGEVQIQGLSHRLSSRSVILDANNQVVSAEEIRVNQIVQIVAEAPTGQTPEVLTLRIVFAGRTTAVNDAPESGVPHAFALFQNYPNPFNPSTEIRFTLPSQGRVTLAIYDLLGRRIRTLVDGIRTAGTHQVRWDGRDDIGRIVASGVYFYRLTAQGQQQTRRLTFIR